MLGDVLRFLVCPLCGEALAERAGAVGCPRGHSFDVARQGYVNLLPGGRPTAVASGDTAEMVSARDRFLAAGHFAPIAEALAEEAAAASMSQGGDGCVAEAGAGTGYYLAAVLRGLDDLPGPAVSPGPAPSSSAAASLGPAARPGLSAQPGPSAHPGSADPPDLAARPGSEGRPAPLADRPVPPPERAGLALDASKAALRRAARAHPRIGAVGCDVWQALPVADQAAAIVLNVFAPRNGAEFRRILAPGGRLLVVTPNPGHLRELVAELGLLTVDEDKPARLAASLEPWFSRQAARDITVAMPLSHADIHAAVLMGPSAWQAAARGSVARIDALPDPLPVTLSVTLSVWAAR